MNKKCSKYEGLYTFGNSKELNEHIKNCLDCQAEQEKMNKISELLQEVKPYYIQMHKTYYNRLKIAFVLGFGLFVGVLLGHFSQGLIPNSNTYTLSSDSTTSSSFNEYGIPVDSYGLITVN